MKKNYSIFRIFFVIFCSIIIVPKHIHAQIVLENYSALSNTQVAQALVDSLMGNGVSFSNASFQGVRASSSSHGYQTGFFTATGSTLTQMGIAKGVVLTSGNTGLISIPTGQNPAANNSFSKGYLSSAPGELRKSSNPINDLNVLAGPINWFNAAILEFDFVPSGDSIVFNYVFGSEEYSDNTNFTNYQCTEYNDKFGFLISGPGINGSTAYDNNAVNIARLANGAEVGINSVNNGTVGSSATPNGAVYCQNVNPSWVLNNTVNEYNGTIAGTAPNGNTKVLQASRGGLTPGATYHIKLLILDAKDGAYDAIVYIEAGSFSSPQPGLSLNANPSVLCQGNSTYIIANQSNGSAPFNYSWSNGVVHNSSSITDSILVNPSVTTTYSLTVTDAQNQTATASIVITVNPKPIPVAGSNSPVCQGSNLNLTVNTGTTWSWAGPNNFISNSQNPVITGTTPAANGTYTVTVTNAQGCTGSTGINVSINALPVAVATSNSPICQGSNLNLTVNTGTSWSWAGPNGFSSNAQNPVITSATTAASGIYTVSITNTQGCTASATVQVTVNNFLSVTASSNSSVCEGNTLNLSANTGTTWNWTGPNGFTSTLQNPDISNVSSSASGIYTVQVSNAQGCTGSATTNVVINTNPVPLASSNSPVCENGTLSLQVNTGSSWSWVGPNGFNSNVQNPSISNITSSASGNYTVTVTDNNSCNGTATVNVLVNLSPTLSLTANPSMVCLGDSVALNISGGLHYIWNTGDTDSLLSEIPLGSTTYSVTATTDMGCSAIAQINITVHQLPMVSITPTQAAVCEGDQLTLTASSNPSASQFLWSNGITTHTLTETPLNNSIYAVTVTDVNGCTGESSTSVIVNPLPDVAFEADIMEGCSPLIVSFSSQSSSQNTHQWSFGDNSNSTLHNPNHSYLNAGLYDVTLEVTTAAGCSNVLTKTNYIEVYPHPVASFYTNSNLNDMLESEISFTNLSTGAISYEWHFGDEAETVSTELNPVFTYTQDGQYTVWLYVVNEHNCTDSTSRDIDIKPLTTFYIPTAFTPNNDGVNDYFSPVGVGFDANGFEMYIYDRWGKLIFNTNDINYMWDGSIMGSGNLAVNDVYSWVIFFKKSDKNQSHVNRYVGSVTLLR